MPVDTTSSIFISLSITISAPVFVLANSSTAITILYISSFVLVAISLSIPKKLANLFVPICSNALLISGWNITIKATTPEGNIAINTECTIVKCNMSLSHVANITMTIPFINCITFEFLASFINFTNTRTTIVKSNTKDTNFIGYWYN